MQNTLTVQSQCRVVTFLSPAGMAEVLECKAAWRLASQGAWGRWHCGEPRCSGTQGGGRGNGPSADQVVRAGAGQLWKKVETY